MVKEFKLHDVTTVTKGAVSGLGVPLEEGASVVVVQELHSSGYLGVTVQGEYFSIKPEHLNPVELPEPDLHVYPDTPVGTVLVVTEDTKSSVWNVPIPKGTEVVLASTEYHMGGTCRSVDIPPELTLGYAGGGGLGRLVDCDVLMIKG